MAEDRSQESISWGELAELTHATQVERFGFCGCEDNEGKENPFSDCPKATYHGITQATCLECGKVTRNISTLEMMNDLDARCPACDTHLVAWFTNGQIIITGETEKGEEIRLEVKP
jgi:DNA-directed RNA polymerase subunit RPC12/RpoP